MQKVFRRKSPKIGGLFRWILSSFLLENPMIFHQKFCTQKFFRLLQNPRFFLQLVFFGAEIPSKPTPFFGRFTSKIPGKSPLDFRCAQIVQKLQKICKFQNFWKIFVHEGFWGPFVRDRCVFLLRDTPGFWPKFAKNPKKVGKSGFFWIFFRRPQKITV